MAWSARIYTDERVWGTDSYHAVRDIIDAEQLPSADNMIRIQLTRSCRVMSADVPAGSVCFICGSDRIYSPELPGVWHETDWAERVSTAVAELPAAWAGKPLRIMFRDYESNAQELRLDCAAPFIMRISRGEKLTELSVRRVKSPSGLGTLGELRDGDPVYSGDELELRVTAAPGYAAHIKFCGIEAENGSKVTVSAAAALEAWAEPMATVHLHDGTGWGMALLYVHDGSSWQLHQVHVRGENEWEKYF